MSAYDEKSLVEVRIGGWSQEISLGNFVEAGKGVVSDVSDPPQGAIFGRIRNIVSLTQFSYDAIANKDAFTLYIIDG